MLNLKKVILGLGLLGVVSYANAAYVECLESGYTKGENMYYGKGWKWNYNVGFLAPDGKRYESWGDRRESYESCSGAADDACTIAYNNIPAGYKEVFYGEKIVTLCSQRYTITYKHLIRTDVCNGTISYCVTKPGSINDDTSTTTAVSTLTNENNLLKAKVQALETKVYQCVQ